MYLVDDDIMVYNIMSSYSYCATYVVMQHVIMYVCRDIAINFRKQISVVVHMNRQYSIFSKTVLYYWPGTYYTLTHTMYMYVCTNVATYVPALAWSVNMCECPAAAQSGDVHMNTEPIL